MANDAGVLGCFAGDLLTAAGSFIGDPFFCFAFRVFAGGSSSEDSAAVACDKGLGRAGLNIDATVCFTTSRRASELSCCELESAAAVVVLELWVGPALSSPTSSASSKEDRFDFRLLLLFDSAWSDEVSGEGVPGAGEGVLGGESIGSAYITRFSERGVLPGARSALLGVLRTAGTLAARWLTAGVDAAVTGALTDDTASRPGGYTRMTSRFDLLFVARFFRASKS